MRILTLNSCRQFPLHYFSLFAWAKRAEISFVTQKIGEVNDDMIAKLNSLQDTYEICKDLSDKEEIAIQMKYEVDEITKIMIVPLVRNLIVHLAAQSGIADKEAGDEIDYMVLYSLSVLPMISICDEDVFDDLYTDLVKESRWYDSSNFSQNLKLLQDRFACLGISCSDVGESVLFGPTTSCSSQEKVLDIAGYSPTSAVSFHVSHFKT